MKYLLVVFGIPACLGMAWYVYDDAASEQQIAAKKKAEAAVAVEVASLETRAIRDTVQLVGRLEPRREVTLRARVAGYIVKPPPQLNDPVKANETLIKLDDTRMKQDVETANAAVKVAEAQLKVADEELKPAEETLSKFQSAQQQGAVTQQQVDEAKSAVDVLKTRKALALENVNSAKTDLKIKQAALKETEIVSRFDGFVAYCYVKSGALANPNDPLLKIVDVTKVWLEVWVVETKFGKVRVGQTTNVRVDALRGRKFVGKVVRKAPELDRVTKTGLVKIEVDNAAGDLHPGMTARAEIIVKNRPKARVVPVAALMEVGDDQFVYVMDGKPARARRRDVQVGLFDGKYVEIVSGLESTDRVITLGNRLLTPGQLVVEEEGAK